MDEMTKSHFIDKYNKLLILLNTNEDEDEIDNNNLYSIGSSDVYYKKPNVFDFNFIRGINKGPEENIINDIDISIENININNVRDLLKNKNKKFISINNNSKKKAIEEFKMENNHSEILVNNDKLSYNPDEISIDTGDMLNEINFTESAASTYRDNFQRKIGSVIKPSNTFNNLIAQDIEYHLDLERAKRNKRNRQIDNIFTMLNTRKHLFENKNINIFSSKIIDKDNNPSELYFNTKFVSNNDNINNDKNKNNANNNKILHSHTKKFYSNIDLKSSVSKGFKEVRLRKTSKKNSNRNNNELENNNFNNNSLNISITSDKSKITITNDYFEDKINLVDSISSNKNLKEKFLETRNYNIIDSEQNYEGGNSDDSRNNNSEALSDDSPCKDENDIVNNFKNNDNNINNNMKQNSEFSPLQKNININFTNYGVMNNNLINYNIPRNNNLNTKMLDLFKEIKSSKSISNQNAYGSMILNNMAHQSGSYNNNNKILGGLASSESAKNFINNINSNSNSNSNNFILDSMLNNNANVEFLQSGNKVNLNIRNANQNNFYNNQNNLDYFSEIFKSVENKNTVKGLSERISHLTKKNVFKESNIKGVNNTNNLLNLNSKFTNLDIIFKNNTNTTTNKSSSLKTNIINTGSKISPYPNTKNAIKSRNFQTDLFSNNLNNFDILEQQLDSLKKRTTKTKNNINKLNNLILCDNFTNVDINNKNKNFEEKFNSSLDECENLIINLKESKAEKKKINIYKKILDNSEVDFEKLL